MTTATTEHEIAIEQPTKARRSPKKPRKDKGALHASRHGILGRHVLQALARLGEEPRNVRRWERRFRADLQPRGTLGAILFDRFFSSYLRLLLIARLESMRVVDIIDSVSGSEPPSSLVERTAPTVVSPPDPEALEFGHVLPDDLFHQLAMVQRYDRHFSREMYRSLAMLLLMRDGGKAALEGWIREMLGLKKTATGEARD